MEIIKATEYLTFVKLDREPDKKTDVVLVNNIHHNQTIGKIKWHGPWRQYCFYPDGETIWNKGCLESILEVIAIMMRERLTNAFKNVTK